MRFSQFVAAAVFAAPLVLAAPTTTTSIDLNSDYADPTYATALWQVKEKYPGISDEDAQTAALGYLEAIGVQVNGAPSSTDSLAERDIEKRCCSGCANGNCIIAIFLLGFCCIGSR
ncbi:hypothetical protein TARUN_1071 [Trichoderma arundinaceum]|uniref:Uncharacterized protein n=1 Tax=Trichoderma arundinaceum TaxID=490622 RepID=A0A395NYJ8_TRIAR|nr:hypothetical protein TARUN_1071 [Trichoderma arundinaceum]